MNPITSARPDAAAQVGHHERVLAAHAAGVGRHHGEVGADQRSQLSFVDHEQVRADDAGATFSGDLLAAADVDDVDGEVAELGAEGGGRLGDRTLRASAAPVC
jgi:ABC-type phosphonate transport system ATPase subunit